MRSRVDIESLTGLIHVWLLFNRVTAIKWIREAKAAAVGGTPTPSEQRQVVAPRSTQPIASKLHAAHLVERRSDRRPSTKRGLAGSIRG